MAATNLYQELSHWLAASESIHKAHSGRKDIHELGVDEYFMGDTWHNIEDDNHGSSLDRGGVVLSDEP
jgi:hypothetical protein